MTSLTFYGGVNEIEGNKILLEDKDTRAFLDFGKGFSRRAVSPMIFCNSKYFSSLAIYSQLDYSDR